VVGSDIVITDSATGTGTQVTLGSFDDDPLGDSTTAPISTITFTGADGTDADTSANQDLVLTDTDGSTVTVTLSTDLTSDDGTALEGLIDAALSGEFTTALDTTAGTITLTDDANNAGDFSATLGGSPITATDSATGVADQAAVPATTLTVSDLTIQFGSNDAIAVGNATYSTVQSFVDAVNEALGSNGSASLDESTNVLSINSGEAVTIGGAQAATVFSATSFATSGSLADVDVTSVANSNSAILSIDATLTSISDLRSTFGAIQNRFESTIANLATTTENLTASRSRIQDADFAAETAALTRAQILQQAGISVLAQANAQPQNVLALLQ